MNVVGRYVAIATTHKTPDRSWDAVARFIHARAPRLTLAVLEQIGSWQSSEPELAALQRVWGPGFSAEPWE
jgi:hypothetical protein